MKIQLYAQHSLTPDPETVVSVAGDVLTVDGTPYNLAAIPDGGEATATGDHPFIGKIRRIEGVIHCGVTVRLGPDAAPHQPTDLADWLVDVSAGPVVIPALRRAVPDAIPEDEGQE